jgi:polysaccharide export outer membrane protein
MHQKNRWTSLARLGRRVVPACLGALAVLLGGGVVSAQDASLARPAVADLPAQTATTNPQTDYRIGPLDKLNITVFQVKDLTIEKMQVDAGGQILLPLIGAVTAQGKTTSELSAEIAARLAAHYLQNPQVSVVVEEAVSQKISVEGAVNEAGVFEMKGRTSLLEAVAMAKGTSKNANLHKVTIVRSVDGVPRAATFDLAAISAGKARNPEVFGNDVVLVDSSRSKVIWRGIIEALPALIVFSYL